MLYSSVLSYRNLDQLTDDQCPTMPGAAFDMRPKKQSKQLSNTICCGYLTVLHCKRPRLHRNFTRIAADYFLLWHFRLLPFLSSPCTRRHDFFIDMCKNPMHKKGQKPALDYSGSAEHCRTSRWGRGGNVNWTDSVGDAARAVDEFMVVLGVLRVPHPI